MLTIFFKIMISFLPLLVFAESEYTEEMTYSVGMVNASYTESASALQGENVQEAASGSIASISGNINWKFKPGLDKSYYTSVTFPLLPNTLGTYLGAHTGVEFYFGDKSGSRMKLHNSGTTIKLKPGNVFFWGFEGGLGYLVYSTESSKKTDMLLDLGLFTGMNYSVNEKWNFRIQAGFDRGTGVATATTIMKFFGGLTYFIGE